MANSLIQSNFSAGEISPNLYARVDLEKYVTGAALMRNFFVDYRGGASNRPGTEFIAQCQSNGTTRLIPFIFSTSQSYIFELSDLSLRVYSQGVVVQTLSAPWAADDLFQLKYIQSADVMTVTHPDYPPYNINRTTLTNFEIALVTIGPRVDAPANLSTSATAAGTFQYGYMVTALDANGEESLGCFPVVQASAVLDPTNATPKTIALEWDAVPGASNYNIYKWGVVPANQPLPTLFGYIGQTKVTSFTDTNIAPDYARTPPEYADPFDPGQITSIDVTSGGAGYTGYVALTITGDGSGASAYAVADGSGAISGVVVQSTGFGYTSATVTPASGAATFTANINTEIGYPSVVSYFQQRRVYGGSDVAPELLTFSQTGAYDNFDTSPALLDSDAITVNIASREVNTIKSLVPMSTGLVVFTTGMAFLVAGAGNSGDLTPSSISAVPQASTGASDLPPIVVNYNILFVQAQGSIVRDMAFSFQTQSYYGIDRSMLASHLFFGYSLVDWAWSEEPFKLLWAVRNDGIALAMAYVPDQEVYGWSRHDTNGLFKSVATVPEGLQDATYFVVSRFIQESQTWVNYLERLSFRDCDCPADAAFLDSFVTLPRTAGTGTLFITLSGDDATVTIEAEGSVTYSMDALQNFSPAVAADIVPGNIWRSWFASQAFPGDNFDYVRRQLSYSYCLRLLDDTSYPYSLWDGDSEIAADDLVDSRLFQNYYTAQRGLGLTDGVTDFYSFDPANFVPAGIDSSDGTWRRYMDTDCISNDNTQLRRIIDPRTANCWQHTSGENFPCGLYLLRASDNYSQIISPLKSDTHMEPMGLTADWLYVRYENVPQTIELVPRLILPDETVADEILSYASFDYPDSITAANSYYAQGIDFEKNLWMIRSTKTGTRAYGLYKFEPPTSAPYGGPTVGGGWTDKTPWGTGAGPETGASTYTLNGAFDYTGRPNKNILHVMPNDDGTEFLSIITKLMPADKTLNSRDATLMRWDCTYFNTTSEDWSTQQGFVKGYMSEAWEPLDSIPTNGYAVIDVQTTNSFLDRNDYDFAQGDTTLYSTLYRRRWYFFTVQKVIAGSWSYNAANNHTVIVEYAFAEGVAPQVVAMYDEDLWFDAYSYTGFDNPMNTLMSALTGFSDLEYESGLWDAQTNSWYWGGTQNSDDMAQLDPTYSDRNTSVVSAPMLRIGLGVTPLTPGTRIDVGCGTIEIDAEGDVNVYTGRVIEPLDNTVPDDPFFTQKPVVEGDWFVTEPASQIDVSHLKGMKVGLLVDGIVYPEVIVPDSGLVTWPVEYATTRAVCGLPYQAQLQTLYLDTGEPTTQGKRKNIFAVTMRVDCTAGLKAGDSFDTLVEFKNMPVPYGTPPPHYTGDERLNIKPNWNNYGQVCIQQDYPLPATVLGIIPEVVIGDNQK